MQDGQLPAVGFSDIFFSKHFGRISESDQALIEQGYTTKIFRNGREIVVDDQDGFVLSAHRLSSIGTQSHGRDGKSKGSRSRYAGSLLSGFAAALLPRSLSTYGSAVPRCRQSLPTRAFDSTLSVHDRSRSGTGRFGGTPCFDFQIECEASGRLIP